MNRKKTDYERIKDVWYDKLKKSGFKDIEHSDESMNSGRPRVFRGASAKAPVELQAIQDYYCMSYYFLNEYPFDSELDKVMWEYHSNGIAIRGIVKLINATQVEKTNRIRVWKTIQKLENIMKGLYLSV